MFEIDIAYATLHQIEKGKNMPMEIKVFESYATTIVLLREGFLIVRPRMFLLVR